MSIEKMKDKPKENKIISNKMLNLTDNDINKLKEELTKLNTSDLILEALNSDKNYSVDNNSQEKTIKNDLLEQIRNNSIANFVIDLDIQNKNRIKEKFINEIDKYKNNAELAINRKEKITSEYISKYNKIFEENQLLQKQLYNINNQYYSLEKQLKNSQNQILKMQAQFTIFDKNKQLFTEFFNYFPNDDPIEIMKNYEQRHLNSINIMKENEELRLKIKTINRQHLLDNEENMMHINKLNNKIDLLNKEKNELIENYEIKISKLNNQIKQIQSLEEKNKLLHKMLYQIYNKLIESFKLDKNLKITDNFLNIKEEDFRPNIFDDNELGKYIKLMISTTKPYMCDKLLRETIAYSNMILRVYLKKKVNLRFDPLETFKELKLILEEKEDRIKKLSDLVKNYEWRLSNEDIENKKLSNIIEHIKREKYIKINNKYVDNNINTSNKNTNEESKNKNEVKNIRFNSYNDKMFKKERDAFNNTDNNIRIKTSFKQKQKVKKNFEHNSPNINKIKKRILSGNNKKIKDKKIDFYKNPLYQTLYSMNKNELINKNLNSDNEINNKSIKKYKKIEKNKIYKEHGNQSLITYLNEFNQFINHTNRLFLYKARISPNKHNSLSFKKNNVRKSFNFGTSIEKKLNSKIIGKINNLITSLEMKSELDKKEENNNENKIII